MLYCDSPAIAEQWGVSLKGARISVEKGIFKGMDRMLEFACNAESRLSLGSSLRHVGLRSGVTSRSSWKGPSGDGESKKYSTIVISGWMTKRGIHVSVGNCLCQQNRPGNKAGRIFHVSPLQAITYLLFSASHFLIFSIFSSFIYFRESR